MGARAWMLVYSNSDVAETLSSGPALDRERSAELAHELFPDHRLERIDDGNLLFTAPGRKVVYVGCYADVSIVSASEFGIDYPSKLPSRFLDQSYGETLCLIAMHSVVDWFAYAIWRNGELIRSLSISPDRGVAENIGEALDFEQPFWSGNHPAGDPDDDEPYPLQFHPLDFGDAALLQLFGYQLEGAASRFEPENLALLGFRRRRARAWWKFW